MSIYLWLALLSLVPALINWANGGKNDTSLSATMRSTSHSSNTLFVHLPGLMGFGLNQIESLWQTFLAYGDLCSACYEGRYLKSATRFNSQLIVDETARIIRLRVRKHHYINVVFVGTSLGGKLAYQIASKLLECEEVDKIYSKAVLIDAPLSRHDLQSPLNITAPLMYVLPFIPVLNLIYVVPAFGRFVMDKVFVNAPRENEIEELTLDELKSLDESVRWAKMTRPSFHRGQVLSILRPLHRAEDSPWGPNDVVYIRSDDDKDTVRSSAVSSWASFLGFKRYRDMKFLMLPRAKHCAYGTTPSRYRLALPRAFEVLGLK